jgi:hypothetical protein
VGAERLRDAGKRIAPWKLYAAALATMDPAACNVIYLDQRAKGDRQVRRDSILPPVPTICNQQDDLSSYLERGTEHPDVSNNIQALLSAFNHGKHNRPSPNYTYTLVQPRPLPFTVWTQCASVPAENSLSQPVKLTRSSIHLQLQRVFCAQGFRA